MKSLITQRQKQFLQIIYDFIRDTGFSPSFEEMRQNLHVSSNQSVIDLLSKLEKARLVKRNDGSARGLTITQLGLQTLGRNFVPVVGVSAAGPFLESFSEVDFDWIEISKTVLSSEPLKQSKDTFFVIRISGDSMINAGIHDGNMLLVRKANEFSSGDIVVARNDQGTTVKRFIVDGGRQYLKPENPTYENIPIIPEEIYFEGKVVLNLSKI